MRDTELKEQISVVFEANYRVYGARKISRELNRQGHHVALPATARGDTWLIVDQLSLVGGFTTPPGARTSGSARRARQAKIARARP
ncbi:IS3 family transposase [Streptomyces guryensis]|uniref:IS3 family transposase n=1 Tax=Streptomyces guryensis TaxID=2886947 RepID=UPI0035591983